MIEDKINRQNVTHRPSWTSVNRSSSPDLVESMATLFDNHVAFAASSSTLKLDLDISWLITNIVYMLEITFCCVQEQYTDVEYMEKEKFTLKASDREVKTNLLSKGTA